MIPISKEAKGSKAAAASVANSGGSKLSGCFNWKYILLLLLLLLLLLWLLRGCFGAAPEDTIKNAAKDVGTAVEKTVIEPAAETTKEITQAVKETVTETKEVVKETKKEVAKKVEKVKEKVKPTPPVTTSSNCNCSDLNREIFRFDGQAKNITKLGSLPEFGNSHSLDPSGFYNKLSNRYNANIEDKNYLNYIFKSMGYKNGFSDATANMFSDTTLKRGTKGNLGFGEYHGYAYSTLNTEEYDRKAFLIKSKNGCDIHFMKTCGNYFFYCNK